MAQTTDNQAQDIISEMLWAPMAQQFHSEQQPLKAGDLVYCTIPEATPQYPAGEFCAKVIVVFGNGKVLVQGNGLDTTNQFWGTSVAIPMEQVVRSI